MEKIKTLLLSAESAERLKAWQRQFPAVETPPGQETKRERINRLRSVARKRRLETGVMFNRPRRAVVTKEIMLANSHRDELSGCWIWDRGADKNGYGKVRDGGVDERTHRVAWRLWHGEIPVGIKVLHHCDNPPCFNPDHLFLGTSDDNIKDAAKKERMHKKLTFEQVQMIRGDSRHPAEISASFGISERHVIDIMNGVKRTIIPNRIANP